MEFDRGSELSAGNKPHYLDSNHPNYKRWKRSREISYQRGKFVKSIVSQYKKIMNLKILDIGSGFGGTIQNFLGNGNLIYSIEKDEYKLHSQLDDPNIKKFLVDAFHLPFNEKFDIIILQDFIEHIDNPETYLKYILNFLTEDGIIYLSTPNKLSILNLISDPHWGFPLVSIMSRKNIQKFFVPIFRKKEKDRKDVAELKSLNELIKIFKNCSLDFRLHTKFAVKTIFENPEQIIWSDLHQFLLKSIKFLRLRNLMFRLADDKIGFVNKYFTPSFYFVLGRNINLLDLK